MLFVLLLLVASTTGAWAQRLHVVFALEKNNREMGLISLGNDELMTQVMETVKWGLGYPMTMTYLPKQNFTSTKLKSTLAALPTGPNDVIVLYYSGFGAMPTRPAESFANWQLTDVAQQGLPVSDVETWLMAKKARLRVIIADCSAQLVRNDEIVAGGITMGPDLRKQVIRRLFQKPCGLVKLGSSLPSQPAWVREGMTGSVFTAGFNQGFQNLLIATADSASLARVSWPSMREITAGAISGSLYKMPFEQQPVLELKPCQKQPGSVAAPVADPLANETLSGLFTGLTLNPDSLQRARRTRQLLALCDNKTTVSVSRFMSYQLRDMPAELPKLKATYPLTDYLKQARRPLPLPAGTSLRTSRLRVITVTDKVVETTGPTRIKSVTVREDWISY